LQNIMSLYQGSQNALGAISGGQGANTSQVGYSPFSASTGYFNVGRYQPIVRDHGHQDGVIGIDTAGGTVNPNLTLAGGLNGTFRPVGQQAFGIGSSAGNPVGDAGFSQNGGQGYRPTPAPQSNPFVFRGGK